ncbi:ComF family protein [Candidatus Poriferisocius sp.]|uniref:ComF family protein n=1 Tax=Candidatus Poriferisocius sp. TaxID=3101276 RepID=UPI003B5163F8
MLFLRVCAGCGGPGPSPCGPCRAGMRAVGEMLPPEPLSGLWAAFAYADAGRELLARLKYRNQRSCVGWVASAMAGALPSGLVVEAVTWAPTSPRRRRRRGFDQAELLARALGRETGLTVVSLLKRVDAAGQTGRSRSQRYCAPVFAPCRSPQSAVLVVDDVVTTGATLQAAASALIRAGARHVEAVVAGATPLPSLQQPPGVTTMRSHNSTPAEREPPWT